MSIENELLVDLDLVEKDYREKGRYTSFLFTINNYDQICIDYINEIKENFQYLVIGYETGEECNTPHIQGFCIMKDSKTKTAVIDILNASKSKTLKKKYPFKCHAHVIVASCKSNKRCSDYCLKGEQSKKEWTELHETGPNFGKNYKGFKCGFIKCDKNENLIQVKFVKLIDCIKDGMSLENLGIKFHDEFLKYNNGFMKMYNLYKPKTNFCLYKTYGNVLPWQEFVINFLSLPANDRTINHIYDPIGESGKSKLTMHLEDNLDFTILSNMKTADASYLWQSNNVCFDFSRKQEDKINYAVMEDLKNGRINSTKYECCRKKTKNNIHVICFANFLPKFDAFSLDRWKIYELEKWNNNIKLSKSEYFNLENKKNCEIKIIDKTNHYINKFLNNDIFNTEELDV